MSGSILGKCVHKISIWLPDATIKTQRCSMKSSAYSGYITCQDFETSHSTGIKGNIMLFINIRQTWEFSCETSCLSPIVSEENILKQWHITSKISEQLDTSFFFLWLWVNRPLSFTINSSLFIVFPDVLPFFSENNHDTNAPSLNTSVIYV